jgi:hypothetical protein
MKWHINCKLVVVQPTKLSTTGLPSITCARWVRQQLTELHEEKRVGICQWLADRYGGEGDHFLERILMGDGRLIHHYEPEEILQKRFFWGGGANRGYCWNNIKRGFNSEQCSLQRCCVRSYSLHCEAKVEDCCQQALRCCVTVPVLTLLKPLRKQSYTYWLIRCTVPTLPLRTKTRSVHLKTSSGLPRIRNWSNGGCVLARLAAPSGRVCGDQTNAPSRLFWKMM